MGNCYGRFGNPSVVVGMGTKFDKFPGSKYIFLGLQVIVGLAAIVVLGMAVAAVLPKYETFRNKAMSDLLIPIPVTVTKIMNEVYDRIKFEILLYVVIGASCLMLFARLLGFLAYFMAKAAAVQPSPVLGGRLRILGIVILFDLQQLAVSVTIFLCFLSATVWFQVDGVKRVKTVAVDIINNTATNRSRGITNEEDCEMFMILLKSKECCGADGNSPPKCKEVKDKEVKCGENKNGCEAAIKDAVTGLGITIGLGVMGGFELLSTALVTVIIITARHGANGNISIGTTGH